MMTLLGKGYRLPAARAHQLGFVDVLEAEPAEAEARAYEFAQLICTNSPQAVTLSKRAIWTAIAMSLSAAQNFGWELIKSQWRHPDFIEGPKAFMEKRQPVWDPNPDARN